MSSWSSAYDDPVASIGVLEVSPASMSRTPVPSVHRSVLLEPVGKCLAPQPGQIVVDCTVGTGGHSLALLPSLLPEGHLIAIDRDGQALEIARKRLAEFTPNIHFVQDNFQNLPAILTRLGHATVDRVVADVGLSSLHVEDPQRGFSFLREGPLDMRMDQRQGETAAALIARLSEEELATLIRDYGEDRWAWRIARRIVACRRSQPIHTTTQLASVIAGAMPRTSRRTTYRIHPATRTFLALRIAVNDELGSLRVLLQCLPEVLSPGGRAAVIAFHSLEDRLVKRAFQRGAQEGVFRIVTKKPIRPTDEEIAQNTRARSAKLRAVERC